MRVQDIPEVKTPKLLPKANNLAEIRFLQRVNGWFNYEKQRYFDIRSYTLGIDIGAAKKRIGRDGPWIFVIQQIHCDPKGQGKFTWLLDNLETQHHIMVECIVNERLHPFLERRGYSRYGQSSRLKML